MASTLILITGAPGVGKTAVAKHVLARLPNSAWLDGDDVWRMNPFRVDDITTGMVERNIQFVLRQYLTSGFSFVILSWVLHRQAIIDRILDGLRGLDYELFVFTLVCDEATLIERLGSDALRRTAPGLALQRLHQSRDLPTNKMDTTDRLPEQVADEIVANVTTCAT